MSRRWLRSDVLAQWQGIVGTPLTRMQSTITYSLLSSDDVASAIEIERKGYPADEAGKLDAFQFRQSNAGKLFLGAYHVTPHGRKLIGYVSGTLSSSETLTYQSMSEHIPSSTSVCIHSVCVSDTYRRTKVGLNLLKEYISRLEIARTNGERYERVLLITHEHLRSFYEQAGFEWIGRSSVEHGSQPWYEMRKTLGRPSAPHLPETLELQPEVQQIPAGVWAALQRSSSAQPAARIFTGFPGGILELSEPRSTKQGNLVNKFDIVCPRSGCGSIILKHGVGEWVERESVQMEPEGLPIQSILPPLPPPPETCQWWLITPSPMEFENIGFSRPIHPPNAPGPKLKLLACAECDLGPLGWCEEGGKEFWLACTRVGYLA